MTLTEQERAKRKVARLKGMLRKAEDDARAHEQETVDIQVERVNRAFSQYARVVGKIAELDRRLLEKDKGWRGIFLAK